MPHRAHLAAIFDHVRERRSYARINFGVEDSELRIEPGSGRWGPSGFEKQTAEHWANCGSKRRFSRRGMPVRTWLPTLPVPNRRNGVSLFALLSVIRRAAIEMFRETNSCRGLFCGIQMYLPGLKRHQKGPREAGLDSAALISLATSKDCCGCLVVGRVLFRCHPECACANIARLIRQGGSSPEHEFANSDAKPCRIAIPKIGAE